MRTKPPHVDPQLRAKLDAYAGPKTTGITMEKISDLRKSLTVLSIPDETIAQGGAVTVKELMIPGPREAPDLPLLICSPTAAQQSPTPAIYHIHGGGMFMGDNRFGLFPIIEWIDTFGVTIASVDYRLAPENPYPAPQEDCYAGLKWLAENGAELGIDTQRIVVAGASAGGGLAAATALMARDRSGPALSGQVLLSPMLDDRTEKAPGGPTTDGVFDHISRTTAWSALLGPISSSRQVQSYAAPARETNFTRLPATYIEVGSAEIFRNEVIRYTENIWAAGGHAELHVWPGAVHGFDHLMPSATLSKVAREARRSWLMRILAGTRTEC